jgi:integrase
MSKLTIRSIDALAPTGKDYLAFDDEVPGFGVRVFASGKKSYCIQYRAGGRTRRVTFARVGTQTPDEARKIAKKLLHEVAEGGNPAQARINARRAPTMAAACDRFISDYVEQRLKPTTQREYRRAVELFIKPALGTFKVEDVVRADVADLHHKHRDKPYQANRTLGVLSKLFNLIEVWGLRPDGSNPCRHVPKYRESKRERFLSREELQRLGQVLDGLATRHEESPFVIAAFKLLLYTGCRLREIQDLKWSYVKGDRIELPDSKTGARRIPLPLAAQHVIEALPAMPDNEYVIAGKLPGENLTDLERPWRRIRKLAGLTDVRIHDLRHTYASHAVAQGMNLPMVAKLLGHTQIQTTQRYAHLADEQARRAAGEVSSVLSDALETVPSPQRPNLSLVK